eukprot:scaffold14608_cov102-Cylindrotheca_fusiformis.AAC.2
MFTTTIRPRLLFANPSSTQDKNTVSPKGRSHRQSGGTNGRKNYVVYGSVCDSSASVSSDGVQRRGWNNLTDNSQGVKVALPRALAFVAVPPYDS